MHAMIMLYPELLCDWLVQSYPFSTSSNQLDLNLWVQFSDRSTKCIIKIVEFAKQIPGFCECSMQDQITLIKSASMDVLVSSTCCVNDDRVALDARVCFVSFVIQIGAFPLARKPKVYCCGCTPMGSLLMCKKFYSLGVCLFAFALFDCLFLLCCCYCMLVRHSNVC